ncbi:MAG: hypothetical protein M0019_00865 [Actinomycetota bacterium]|jgi:hypothetical protein|nr:hypothetical protein [Actinomycetota bacterium]
MLCENCRLGTTVEISLTVGGHLVSLVSCSHCDKRIWQADGKGVEVNHVLTMANGMRK